MDEALFSDAVETFFESFLRGKVHTAQPGEIVKVVSANPPIVNVQPAFMRLREGAENAEARPVIPNVPLIFPVFGNYGVLSEIHVGTPVLLIAAERSIKNWVEQGKTCDPGVDRIFDLSDCVAIPGLSNKTVEWSVPQAGVQIGTIDGANIVSITDGAIDVKTDTGDVTLTAAGNVVTSATETVLQDGTDYAVQFTALKTAFDTLKSELNALVTAYNAHVHITTATVGATPTPGVIAPTTSTGTPPVASMDGAKVAAVRLP